MHSTNWQTDTVVKRPFGIYAIPEGKRLRLTADGGEETEHMFLTFSEPHEALALARDLVTCADCGWTAPIVEDSQTLAFIDLLRKRLDSMEQKIKRQRQEA